MAEHSTVNRRVAGSSPAAGARIKRLAYKLGVFAMMEHRFTRVCPSHAILAKDALRDARTVTNGSLKYSVTSGVPIK